jgi:drug/metabolite transporter (DMT)-like permease
MTAGREHPLGVACIVASAACFGSMALFARIAYASGADTTALLFLRFSIAAALTWALVAVRRPRLPGGRALAILVGMGAVGYAGQAFCYFTAVHLASAGLVALLLYLYPPMVALLSRLLLRQHLSRPQLLALALAFAGSALTIGEPGGGRPLGIAAAILGALIYACYILAGSRLPTGLAPASASAVILTSAAAVYGGAVAAGGARLPGSTAGWGAVLAIAVICTVLAVALFLAGLERIGPVRASIYSTVEPVVTLLLAALFLGEAITLLRLVGGAMILGAVVLLARLDPAA